MRDVHAQRAEKRAKADPEGALALGVIILTGYEAIITSELFAGPGLKHTYTTSFPLFGADWELTLRKRGS